MKKILLIPFVILAFALFSCQKDRGPITVNNQNSASSLLTGSMPDLQNDDVLQKVYCNNWQISSFIFLDKDVNKRILRINYDSYTFKFCSDNSVMVFYEKLIIPGKWQIIGQDKCNDFLTMGFDISNFPKDVTTDLARLNRSWQVMDISESYMRLTGKTEIGTAEIIFKRV